MVSTDTPASVATAVTVVAEYPLRRNSASAASRTVWRLRRACSRRPLESYRRFLLTRSTIRSTLPYQFHITVTDGLEVVVDADTDRPLAAVERLVEAVNDHDLERLVSCFAEDYINDTPVHPQRAFRGRHQVRKNWTQIFAGAAPARTGRPFSCEAWSSSKQRATRSRLRASTWSRWRRPAPTSTHTPARWRV